MPGTPPLSPSFPLILSLHMYGGAQEERAFELDITSFARSPMVEHFSPDDKTPKEIALLRIRRMKVATVDKPSVQPASTLWYMNPWSTVDTQAT